MSQNLLVERLKAAKRELTALKTAHRRGLGLLKVYKKEYTIQTPGDNNAYWLTIDLGFSISPFPFVQLYTAGGEYVLVADTEFEYKNGGNTAEFRFVWLDNKPTYSFTVYSTSPIESMDYSWERH